MKILVVTLKVQFGNIRADQLLAENINMYPHKMVVFFNSFIL